MAVEHDPYGGGTGRGFAWVGRRRELDLLVAALETPPAVVLVEGEPGVGKSRLVQEATAALTGRGIRVVTGMCHPLREPLPFGPVLDALTGTTDWLPPPEQLNPQAGALAPLLPALADRLPTPPALPEDTRAGRFQLMGAVRSVLDAVGPLVLVVEDLHWADEATRELLLLLARDLPRRLGVVLTYRGEDLPADVPVLGVPYRRPPGTGGAEIHLGPLTEHDVHDLAAAVLGPRANTALSRALFERSAGLPLIVEEDLLTLTTQPRPHHLTSAAPAADDVSVLREAEVPRGLREAVSARMAPLSGPAVAGVEAAAVLAVPADQNLLAEVAGLDPRRAGPAITEALRAAVLREAAPGRYAFRHALARRAVYQDIPGPHRLDLHRQAVRALLSSPSPPLVQIAHHTRALGDVPAWLRQAEAAADQAIELGDDGTASTLIHEILAQPQLEGDLRTRAALALSRIAVNGVDYTTSAGALRRILSAPHLTDAARGEIRLALGLLMVNQGGDAAGGERELKRTIEELATRPDLAARAMVALAVNPNRTPHEVSEWMERAEKAVHDSPNRGARAAVHATRLTLMARANDPAVWDLVERLPRDDADPEVLRQSARALFNVAYYASAVGHDRAAEALLRESLDLARRSTAPLIESSSASQLLRLDWQAGRWEHLEADHTALLARYPDTADIVMEAYLGRGYLAAVRGQWTLALEQLRHAARLGETALEPDCALRAAAVIASLLARRGQIEDAWAVIRSALDKRRRESTWARSALLLAVAVEVALTGGRDQIARDITAEAEQAVAGEDAPATRSAVAFTRGCLLQYDGDSAGAAVCFEQHHRIMAALGRPFYAARGLEATARALAGADPETAARHLAEAADTFAALGATADTARCQQALRELGHSRLAARGRRGYGNQLSPRETEVARLLATGASNKEIAQALALSPRTVEQHVANTLKKLRTTRDNISTTPR